MGGIGSVFTREDYRHKRVASGLMNLAVQHDGARRLRGLAAVRRAASHFTTSSDGTNSTRNFSVLANALALRTPRIRNRCFRLRARSRRSDAAASRIQRPLRCHACFATEADWRANLTFAGNMPADPVGGCEEYFVLARSGLGKIAAYARATRFHGIPMVMEYGYVPSNRMVRTVRSLSASGGDVGDRQELIRNARRPSRRRNCSQAEIAFRATRCWSLIRAHDPELENALADGGMPGRASSGQLLHVAHQPAREARRALRDVARCGTRVTSSRNSPTLARSSGPRTASK